MGKWAGGQRYSSQRKRRGARLRVITNADGSEAKADGVSH